MVTSVRPALDSDVSHTSCRGTTPTTVSSSNAGGRQRADISDSGISRTLAEISHSFATLGQESRLFGASGPAWT